MAESDKPFDSGSRDRATVAQVLSEVVNLGTIVEGHREITRLGLGSVQRQLDGLTGLPVEVASLKERMKSVEDDVGDIKAERERRVNWRRVNLPSLIFGSIGAVIAITSLLTQVF